MQNDIDIKQIIRKICKDTLDGKIQNIKELDKIWPKNYKEEFFDEIYGDITEYFVHLDYTNNSPRRDSWEYLNLYTAMKILGYKKDVTILKRCYDKIVDREDISDVEIDKMIEEYLGSK